MQPTSPVTPSIAQYRCKKPRPLAPCGASNNGWFHRQGLAPSYRHNCSPELPLLLMKTIGLPVAASLSSSGRLAPRIICHPCQLRSEARIPTLVSFDASCRVPTLFLPVRETRLPRLGFFPSNMDLTIEASDATHVSPQSTAAHEERAGSRAAQYTNCGAMLSFAHFSGSS